MTFSFGKVNIKELAQQCGRSRSFMGRVLSGCTSSARMGHFGLQVKRQSEPMLIGLV